MTPARALSAVALLAWLAGAGPALHGHEPVRGGGWMIGATSLTSGNAWILLSVRNHMAGGEGQKRGLPSQRHSTDPRWLSP
jgi:hypothetical protein